MGVEHLQWVTSPLGGDANADCMSRAVTGVIANLDPDVVILCFPSRVDRKAVTVCSDPIELQPCTPSRSTVRCCDDEEQGLQLLLKKPRFELEGEG